MKIELWINPDAVTESWPAVPILITEEEVKNLVYDAVLRGSRIEVDHSHKAGLWSTIGIYWGDTTVRHYHIGMVFRP